MLLSQNAPKKSSDKSAVKKIVGKDTISKPKKVTKKKQLTAAPSAPTMEVQVAKEVIEIPQIAETSTVKKEFIKMSTAEIQATAEQKAAEKAAAAEAKAAAKAAKKAEADAEKARLKAEKDAKFAADKAAAEAAKPPKAAKVQQNGVTRPKEDTICGQLWKIYDALNKEGAPTQIADALAVARASAINDATTRTQYAHWRKFMGIEGRTKTVVVPAPVAAEPVTAEAPTEAVGA